MWERGDFMINREKEPGFSINRENLIKNVQFLINLGIAGLVLYNMFVIVPAEKEIYEECNLKVLCQMNRIDSVGCEIYYKPNITLNVTPSILND